MKVGRLCVLNGPNVWAACPVVEAGIDPTRWEARWRNEAGAILDRIRAWLPTLDLRLDEGDAVDAPAHLVKWLTLHLQTLAGEAVTFGATRNGHRPGCYRVAVEFREEVVGRACLQAALAICRAAYEGRPFAVEAELTRLRELAEEQRPGPGTGTVVEAARARGIPVIHLNPEDGRYLLLGQGARQRRTLATETDDVSAVARSITTDKHLTKLLLRDVGVPVPSGRPVRDAEDAWEAACELDLPVVVKPQDRDLAQGVRLDLRTREQVFAAYEAARGKSPCVMVERFAAGAEHRLLVVGDRVVAAARIDPPHVVGDGTSRILDLVEAANRDPRRGEGPPAPLRRLRLDADALRVLAGQGHTPDSVPPAGARVLLRRDPPLIDNGGSVHDVTERVHPRVAACAVAAAQALRVRVAGVDVVAEDISRPLEGQGGVIVEVNTGPGPGMHLAPWSDCPRPVGEAIIASMFAPGNDGRIPVLGVTGAGAQAAGRRLDALLTGRGFRVGRAGRDVLLVAGRRIVLEGTTAFTNAGAVLRNNLVDVAVLEASGLDLLSEGFGCDRCDVALITGPPEPGWDEGDFTAEELAESCAALLRALAPGGQAVLNADAPPPPGVPLPPAERIIWYAQDGDHPRLADHRAAGGTTVFLSADSLVVARGTEEQRLAFGGQPIDQGSGLGVLAALAGAMTLNLCGDVALACEPAAPVGAASMAASP